MSLLNRDLPAASWLTWVLFCGLQWSCMASASCHIANSSLHCSLGLSRATALGFISSYVQGLFGLERSLVGALILVPQKAHSSSSRSPSLHLTSQDSHLTKVFLVRPCHKAQTSTCSPAFWIGLIWLWKGQVQYGRLLLTTFCLQCLFCGVLHPVETKEIFNEYMGCHTSLQTCAN